MEILKFCKTRDVKSPERAHNGDAGIDFYVPEDFRALALTHGASALVPSGIKVEVPYGWMLCFYNKSGVASKMRLDVMACVVDHGYMGEIHLNVINNGTEPIVIKPGMKLLQGILLPIGLHEPIEVGSSELYDAESARGTGGFGSTGA